MPDAYVRDDDRAAPHNLYVRPGRVLAAAPDASTAKDIGFRFGASPPPGGRAVPEYTVRYPAARFSFAWSAEQRRWLVSMGGTPARTTDGGRLGAATVVIRYVTVRPSQFHDRLGAVSPYTDTRGSGAALVLRGGRSYEARWVRQKSKDGTAFTTPAGEHMEFAPGPVRVLYTA